MLIPNMASITGRFSEMGRPDKIITYDSILFGAAVGLLSAAGMHYYKKWKKQSATAKKEWHRIGVVSELYLYPLKSGHRIQLETGFCTKEGLQMEFDVRDRSFIVYNPEKHRFRTARDYPKLLNIKLEPRDKNTFILHALDQSAVQIHLSEITTESTVITMHEDEKIYVRDCGDDAAEWLSNYLLDENTGLRLGFYDSTKKRDITETHGVYLEQYKNLSNAAVGLQSELTSYHIINQVSVDDLSARIKTDDISVHNFRPNIVIKTDDGIPYAEDKWDKVKIGKVELYYVAPCTRCVLTTIDPVRFEKSKSIEPMTTLRKYRRLETILKDAKFEKSLGVMGVSLGLNVEGNIAVGDSVYVQMF